MTDQNDSLRRRARPLLPQTAKHKAFRNMRLKQQDGHNMRTINRFFAAARILGACAVAALLTIAAAPQAMAQIDTNFTAVNTTPAAGTTVPGLFEVTYQFTTPDGDDADTDPDPVFVSGFTISDITVESGGASVGTVQSIRVNQSTRVYTVRILANSDHNDEAGETGALTVTLASEAVEYVVDLNDPTTPDAADDTRYTNTSAETLSLTVDQIKPTVTFQVEALDGTADDATGGNLVNGKFQVRFTFNEDVTGFALSDISAPNTTKSDFTEVTAGTVYTADFMPNNGFSGDIKVTIPAGSVNDAVGNLNESDDIDVKIDQAKPTVMITAPSQWGNESFMATIRFSEAVQNFAAGDITIAPTPDTETAPSATISAGVLNADGSQTYIATVAAAAAAITQLDISIAADAVDDLAGIGAAGATGNGNTVSNTATVAIDAARPTASISTFSPTEGTTGIDLSPEDTTTFTATIVFSEAVIGFQQGGNDITVTNGTVTLAGALPGTSFTATITPTAGYEGEMMIVIPAGAAMASADNTKTNPRFTQTVRVSQGAPTVKVEAEKTRANGPFGITITFSEAVTGFMMDEITISDTATPAAAEVSNFVAVSGTTYTATVTPSDDAVGTAGSETAITISVAAGVAMDIVGNLNTASPAVGSEENPNPVVTFDDTAPTVTISAPGSASAPFEAIFTFNEDLAPGTFTAADITVVNGTAGQVSGTGDTFTSMITPTSGFNGDLTINIAADRVTDIAGNGNMAHDRVPDVETDPATEGSQPYIVTIDQVAPTATIEDTTPPGQRKENDAFTITITFNEAVTGLTTDGIAVSSSPTGKADDANTMDVDESQLADATVTSVSGGGTSWTAVITPRAPQVGDTDQADTPLVDESMPFNGNLTVQVKADAAADSSAGGNTASNILTVNINTVRPTLTIATSDTRGAGTNFKEAFTATFTFDKVVTGFDATDIVITNGSIVTPADHFSGSGTTYMATITPTDTFQGALTIAVAENLVQDLHGNGNVVYDSDTDDDENDADAYSVNIDTTAPVPTIVLVNPDTLTQFGHAQNLELTFSFPNGDGGTVEEVTGLMAGDIEFKYVPVSRVVNDNATADNTADDTETFTDGTEANGGASVVSIVPHPDEDNHTYTVTINPAAFSRGSPTTAASTTPANSMDTTTPNYRRKLRVYFPADGVMDLAANNNVILPDQDTGETGDQNYVEILIVPDIPSIAITTPGLTTTAFNDNPFSDGTAFMVHFNFSASVGVFDVADVDVDSQDTGATITEFTGSGTSYTAKVTPTQREVDETTGAVTTPGFKGNLIITVAANINNLGNFAASHTVYVDQDPPAVTTMTGPYLQDDEGMRIETATSLPATISGDPFYVQVTFSEQVENLGPAGFDIYMTGDSNTVKTQVGTASDITMEDVAADGTHTWTAKITPNAGFNGNITVMVKAGAAMDRAGTVSTLPDPAPAIGTDTSALTVDQRGPVPMFVFNAAREDGNREVGGEPVLHNVIPATATTYTVQLRFQNGDQTTDTNMRVYEQVDAQLDGEDNFTTADVVLTPTGAGEVTSVTGSGTGVDNVWTVTVTPTADTDTVMTGDQPYEGPITIMIPMNRLKDLVGNDNAASNSFTVMIDKTAPLVSSITGTDAIALERPFDLTVTFNEDVTGFETAPNLTVVQYTGESYDGTNGGAALSDGSGYDITVAPVGDSARMYKATITLDGTSVTEAKVFVYVDASAATDLAGTANPVSWDAAEEAEGDPADVYYEQTINRTSPVLTMTRPEGTTEDPNPGTDGSHKINFAFNKIVTGFDAGDIQVTNGSIVSGSFAVDTTDLMLYTARFLPDGLGDLMLFVPANAAQDAAQNGSLAARFTQDLGRPSATIKVIDTNDNNNELTGPQNGAFTIELQFDESISSNTQTAPLGLAYQGGSETGGAWDQNPPEMGDRYTATVTPAAFLNGAKDFTLVIGLAANTVEDLNDNGNFLAQKTVMIDQTAPTVMITPTEIGNNVANGNRFPVTFTFSELVTGFAEADITGLTGGTLVAGTLTRALMDGTAVTDPTAAAQVYTVMIDPTSGVTEVSFTLAASVVEDLAGNMNAEYDGDPDTANAQPHSITVDTVRPKPVIAGPANDEYGSGPFLITVTFTDDATADPLVAEGVTGFEVGDLTVAGGTASGFTAVSESEYQINITPTSGVDTITVDIAENLAQDGAGNMSLAADQYTATRNDQLPYVVSITAPVAARAAFTATVTFNRAVSGFDAAADVMVTGGTAGVPTPVGTTDTIYNVMITPNPAVADDTNTPEDETAPAFEGDLAISVPAGAATASVGGQSNVASARTLVRIDLTAPQVESFVLNNGQPLRFNQFNFPVAITFNEDMDVTTWAASDLTVSGGAVTSVGSNGSRTLTANISSPTQLTTVTLGANVVADIVGNGNAAHASVTIARGTNAPTVSVSVADGSLTRNTSPFQVRIVFNQPVTGFVIDDLTVTGGTKDQFQAVSGQIYTARITPTAGQSSVAISVAANVAVNSGNIGNAASGTLTVNISTSTRTVSVTSPAQGPVTGPFNVNISFSENTGGFEMGDITVLNGSVTSLNHVSLSRNWVASITPTGPEVQVYLVQNVVNGGNAPSNVFRIRSNVGSSVPSGLSVSLTGQAAVKAGASTVNILFTRDGVGVPVTGLALSDLSVTPSSIALTNLTPHATDAGRYMVTLTPPNDFEGDVTVTLAANAAIDDRGNNSPGGSFQTRVDSTPPTVTISGPTGPSNGAVGLTFTFSEPVTGFDAADLMVSGGTAGDITGSDAVYMATITPAADYNGELTADIAAEAAMDAAGNMSTAAEQYAVMIDQTPPTVAVTGPEGPIKDEMIMIMIAFSEAVTGFELSDIAVGNGSASDLVADETTPGHYTAMVQADSGFEGMLTVDIAAGAAADMATNASMAAEQYAVEVVLDTSFTIALNQGLNMIHVPVKVDGLAMVSNLYDALGGSSDVLYILSLDGSGNFVAYVGIPGSSGDTALSDQTAVVVNMRTAKSVTFTGGLLDDTVSLTQGVNLIGVPRAGAVAMASEVAPNATAVLVLTTNSIGEAQFTLVIPNTPSDVPAAGGQGYIVVVEADDSITYTGEAWEDPEDAAMSAASTEVVKYDPTSTPVLLIEGSFAREDTQEPVNGLEVTITNLRTGESETDTAGLTAGSGRFVKPMIALRGDRYEEGDMLEVSVVDPSGTFGGLTPVRTVVGKDEIAVGRINIGRQLLSAVPYRSDLLPNYPNPFNPETWIPFDLAEASRTTITIYNAAGQTVRVLELGQLPAGQYRSRSKAAYWDGRNALGERVSSGLYFYRIEAGSFSALRRMVILK